MLMQPKRWTAVFRSKRFWAVVAILAVCAILLHDKVNIDVVREEADKLPGWLCFLLLTLLPLVGCPVGVLHAAAGLRFGMLLGMALVCLSIFLQLLASYGLVHWKRDFFARHFASVRRKIPKGAHVPVTVFTMLIPGAPFFAQNYSLALIGVPFRIYLAICLPLHTARSTIAVMLGDQSDKLTVGRVLLVLAYGAAILMASWWALRRLRTKLGVPQPAGNGRTQRGSGGSGELEQN
jgi:uncharacterized membrane protein YdjX (TVP38/TMEM64 family)